MKRKRFSFEKKKQKTFIRWSLNALPLEYQQAKPIMTNKTVCNYGIYAAIPRSVASL
jgi:hypothetical protein